MARGSYFSCATAGDDARAFLWNLRGSESEEPLSLRIGDAVQLTDAVVDPTRRWAATSFSSGTVALWSLTQPHARVFRTPSPNEIHFTGDNEWIVSCSPAGGLNLFAASNDRASYRARETPGCMGASLDAKGTTVLWGGYNKPLHIIVPGELQAREVLPAVPGYAAVVALDASGTIAAAASSDPSTSRYVLRIVHLDSGAFRTFDASALRRKATMVLVFAGVAFAADGTLYSTGVGGIRAWDIRTGASRVVYGTPGDYALSAMSGNGRYLLAAVGSGEVTVSGELVLFDLVTGTRRSITTHGSEFQGLGIDDSGTIIATRAPNGVVRVGPASGGEPHLLLGLARGVTFNVAISHDRKWVATGSGTEIRVWPMPDLSKPPLHTLPREVLLARLRALTNLRVVRDGASPSGYKLDLAAFPGWDDNPGW
jgi:WD40 repeat protein